MTQKTLLKRENQSTDRNTTLDFYKQGNPPLEWKPIIDDDPVTNHPETMILTMDNGEFKSCSNNSFSKFLSIIHFK